MEDLINDYTAWRNISEVLIERGIGGSIDSDDVEVRQCFSAYARLEDVISYTDMCYLESRYEEYKENCMRDNPEAWEKSIDDLHHMIEGFERSIRLVKYYAKSNKND